MGPRRVGAGAASADHTESHRVVRSLRRHERTLVGFEKAPQKIWVRGGCPRPRPASRVAHCQPGMWAVGGAGRVGLGGALPGPISSAEMLEGSDSDLVAPSR